ncbi:MAG: hypothetical protein RLY69_1188 [Verrucomicrobiota bacterium]|jgi:hypothetical protein
MSSENPNDPKDVSPAEGDRPIGKESDESSFESGLWNLDDDSTDWLPTKKIRSAERRVPPTKSERAPRENPLGSHEKKPPFVALNEVQQESRNQGDSHIRLNIRPQHNAAAPAGGAPKNSSFFQEFDELEKWVDNGGEATGKELEDALKLAKLDDKAAVESRATPKPSEEMVEPVKVDEKPAELDSKATETPAVASSQTNYTLLEKFGMTALVVTLLAVFAGILIYSFNNLSVESQDSRKVKFPIAGKDLTVRSAKTYWRDVVRSGSEADVVRRGTRLLPVLELTYSGGPAVLRVMFRDDNGDSVGDAITRRVEADGKVTLAATAGFDDVGMHAAYRTGGNDPWKIEVYEVSGANVSEEGSAKLFEMDISADRR